MTQSAQFLETQIQDEPMEEVVEETTAEQCEEVTMDELISSMITLSSYCNHLYTQAHLIHFNIESPIFLAVHKFLKKAYKTHINQFDTIAELVRTMDYFLPMCDKGLSGAYKGFKHVKSYEARAMLVTYVKNLEDGGMMAKKVAQMAEIKQAPDVQSHLSEICGQMFKIAWMLKSMLRTQTATQPSE